MLELVFAVLLWYSTVLHSSIWVTGFLALCYWLWYTDGKEHTGERRWNAFRRFRLWRHVAPVDRFITNRAALCNGGRVVKRIYVLYPCDTIFAALWSVGLHGGELAAEQPQELQGVVRAQAGQAAGLVPGLGAHDGGEGGVARAIWTFFRSPSPID